MASDNPHHRALKGDVILDSITRITGDKRSDDGLIEIGLVGHPHRYQVRIDLTPDAAPRLVELHLLPLDGAEAEIDPATLRQIPVRRLAKAAARFIGITELPFALAGDDPDMTSLVRPDHERGRELNEAHYRMVADMLISARGLGLSPRQYVAEQLNCSKPTLDRWIARAKDLGFLERDWSNNNGHSAT